MIKLQCCVQARQTEKRKRRLPVSVIISGFVLIGGLCIAGLVVGLVVAVIVSANKNKK